MLSSPSISWAAETSIQNKNKVVLEPKVIMG
jgi:hypothetical protein